MKKNITVLGSTGSIGLNTLDVIRANPKQFKVHALSAYNNVALIQKQIKEFAPKYVAASSEAIIKLQRIFNRSIKFIDVDSDLSQLVVHQDVDVVVIGTRGFAALAPFLLAAKAGKIIAPANKEALVVAGDILFKEARSSGATIIPVDSEQSAIFQALLGQRREDLTKILLTASGGALYKTSQSEFSNLTVKHILTHPRWKMGKKITVDSATLMNKGFEVIEAQRLFNLRIDQIEVIIHPEAIIHSMVEYKDGSVIAQLSEPDMRIPIQYAMTYPNRINSNCERLDFTRLKQLNFDKPDMKKFPSLGLAFWVGEQGGTYPCALNAADEVVVDAFLKEKIRFIDIFKIVEKVVLKHKSVKNPSLSTIYKVDQEVRYQTQSLLEKK